MVKSAKTMEHLPIQIQHLLKLNKTVIDTPSILISIQIQHLLKLNTSEHCYVLVNESNSNTTLVKVK